MIAIHGFIVRPENDAVDLLCRYALKCIVLFDDLPELPAGPEDLVWIPENADEPGFWEGLGYHNYGDPWREQRYRGE